MPIRRDRKKKSEYTPSSKTIVENIEIDEYELDKDLKNLKKVMITLNDINLEEAFWNDSIATSFTDITAHVIIGDGLRIRLEDEKARKVIEEWNRAINVKRQTVEDWIRNTWFDAIIHKHFFWRVDDESQEYDNVDTQRLDPKTIEIFEDPVMGYRQFIQHIQKRKYYRSKKQFYRKAGRKQEHDWKKWDSKKITYANKDQTFTNTSSHRIFIPDEMSHILYGDFFQKPPIANAMHYIVYKRWILWFMRKYSQKHWAPFVIIKIGDPKTSTYPTSPQEMQKAIDNASLFIKQITSFGGAAVPGDYTFDTLEKTQSGSSSEIYVTYIRELDKQIMYTIFGSMGQREASGNELATSRVLEKGWLRFIAGVRRQYELLLTNFYATVLLPYHGVTSVKPTDIDIEWSNLIFEDTYDLMRSIEVGVNSGVFKDQNEIRKASQSAFPFLTALEGKDNKSIKEIKIESNPPTGPNQASPGTRPVENNK